MRARIQNVTNDELPFPICWTGDHPFYIEPDVILALVWNENLEPKIAVWDERKVKEGKSAWSLRNIVENK